MPAASATRGLDRPEGFAAAGTDEPGAEAAVVLTAGGVRDSAEDGPQGLLPELGAPRGHGAGEGGGRGLFQGCLVLSSHWAKAGVQARLAGVLCTELLRARPSSTGYRIVTASCHPTSVTTRPSHRVCCVSQNRVCESDVPGSRSRAPAVWSVVSRVDATRRRPFSAGSLHWPDFWFL